ncbi:SDR family oxidoreductase [Streptomyces sp. NPDC050988]|uniref:SDR family oxidoreductase n=1 Tax=Streptomyces sp. NPDC050988 TaxID=3365637 RepID=UPI0037BC2CDC
MRVVVAGANGWIGSRTVARLRDHGVEVVPASRRNRVDVITGRGLREALRGADVVVDVTNPPSHAAQTGLEFFRTATSNLLTAAAAAGVEHCLVLSVVGAERLRSDYFRGKLVQEGKVLRSPLPHSIVRATPFFESVEAMATKKTHHDRVHVAPVLTRPVAADDVAAAVARVAVGLPLFDTLEVAGPEEHRIDDLAAEVLAARRDERVVVTDAHARYFGAELGKGSLLPGAEARTGHTTFAEWLARAAVHTPG